MATVSVVAPNSLTFNSFETPGFADELLVYLFSLLDGGSHLRFMLTCKRMARVGSDSILLGKLALKCGMDVVEMRSHQLWWAFPKDYFSKHMSCLLFATKRDKFWRRLMADLEPHTLQVLDEVEQRIPERIDPLHEFIEARHVLALGDPYYIELAQPSQLKPWVELAMRAKAWWALDMIAKNYHFEGVFPVEDFEYDLLCRLDLDAYIQSTGADKMDWPREFIDGLLRRKQYHVVAKYEKNCAQNFRRAPAGLGLYYTTLEMTAKHAIGLLTDRERHWKAYCAVAPSGVEDIVAMPRVLPFDSGNAAIHLLAKSFRLTQDRYDSIMGAMLSRFRDMSDISGGLIVGQERDFVLGTQSAVALGSNNHVKGHIFEYLIKWCFRPEHYPLILLQGCMRYMPVYYLGNRVSEDVLREAFAKYQDFHENHNSNGYIPTIDYLYRDLLPTLFSE